MLDINMAIENLEITLKKLTDARDILMPNGNGQAAQPNVRGHKVPAARIARAKQLHKSGKSLREIGSALNCSQTTAWAYVNR